MKLKLSGCIVLHQLIVLNTTLKEHREENVHDYDDMEKRLSKEKLETLELGFEEVMVVS